MEKRKENNGCGECMECLSKCPECGSNDISIYFDPLFELHTDDVRKNGRLTIEMIENSTEIVCGECNSLFSEKLDSEGKYQDVHGKHRDGKGYPFGALHCQLVDMFGIPYSCTIERKPDCEHEFYCTEWELSSYD